MTKRRKLKENREVLDKEGSLDNSENKVDELLHKFASGKLRRFQQNLIETLLEKNNRITELTTSKDELEEKIRQQEETIRKTQSDLEDLKKLTVKEMNIISEMYGDKIKLFTDELEKKDNEIKSLKAKRSSQNDQNLVKKLKLKLNKRKERSRIQLRKNKTINEDLESDLKVAKKQLKVAKSELEENQIKIEKLEKDVKKVTKENEALKEEVADLGSVREDNEDKEIKMQILTEKNNSNENLMKDISSRNKTLLQNHSNLTEELKILQLQHDTAAHDNFKKQDEIEKLQDLVQTLTDQYKNLEEELNQTNKEKQEFQKTLENASAVKVEKSRINDVVCEDNENLRIDLRKLIEEKLECDKLIIKLKTTIMNKEEELKEERKNKNVQVIEFRKGLQLRKMMKNGTWVKHKNDISIRNNVEAEIVID